MRTISIAGCPQSHLTPDVYAAILAADFAENGVLAVSGGWMDQTDVGMSAIRLIWSERARMREATQKDR